MLPLTPDLEGKRAFPARALLMVRSTMAVRLAFVRPHAEPLLLEPYREARFSLNDLVADGKPVATYVENRWHVRGVGERYGRVEFRSPVKLDGVAYASGHVFACFDKENEDW